MKLINASMAGFVLALGLAAAPAYADGDAAAGEKVFKKCKTCHTLEAGKNRVGPTLAGVFGRTAGTLEGFKFSKVMTESGVVWDETTIAEYVADPKGFMPGNKMTFPGVKDEADRANLIAYLKEAAK